MESVTIRPGDLLCDRFRIIEFIARGGMGELYEAQDEALGERVALKTIRPEIASDERTQQRFRREVQLARKVTHPNICRIFDLFHHAPSSPRSGLPPVSFVTMELLRGETLSQRLKREGRLSPEQALPLVDQMASALSAAHAAGIVHRDFKSNNVMLVDGGPGGSVRAVVTDFGLAFRISDASVAGAATISAAGELIGTPDYMAPEQLEGSEVTPATDIYALGIVIYEMVTGERPFTADTPVASALRRLSGPPVKPPSSIVPGLSGAWDRAVMRCLSRYPESRFSEAVEIVRAIESEGHRRGSRWRLSRRIAAALVLAALGLALGVVASRRDADPASPAATAASATAAMRPAVAVLGFRNLAGNEEAQWLSTALAEMLTTELAAGESLRTIPGENIDRMKMELALADADSYAAETLAQIRQNLGTDLVVSGSYVTVGAAAADGGLRVDIRLQDAREGRTIFLVSETGRSAELFDIVSRAGTRLRERMGAAVVPAAMAAVRASRPATSEAARLYAEGLTRLRRLDALNARQILDQAIQADPRFPLAHSALASAWAALGYDDRARQAAARAFELSTELSRSDRLAVEGTYREMASAWNDAIAIWQTLSTFFPDDVEHVLRLANARIASGAAKEGLAAIEEFRKRFPAVKDPRLELAEAAAAETLSDFKRMKAAASAAAAAGEAQGARLLVAAARLREGAAVLRQGRSEEAVARFEDAHRIYSEAGDRIGAARALNNLASAISDGPDTRRTVALYEEGLAIARSIGNQDLVARFLNNLAIQERRAGNFQASLKMNRESLAIRRETGDRTNTAVSLNNIGNALLDLGDLAGASRHYEESAQISREIGDRRSMARALHNAAESLTLQGEIARARATTEEALRIRRGIDDPAGVATSLYGLGQITAMQGDLAAAKQTLTEALEMDRRLDRRRAVAYSLFQLGDVALLGGDLAEARRRHQEALEVRSELGERSTMAESRTALAGLMLEEGRAADAEVMAREAAAVLESQAAPESEARARAMMALAMLAQGRRAAADREVKRALQLVRNPQSVLARMSVGIAAARIEGAANPQPAIRTLETIRADAVGRGIPRLAFEARRAILQLSPTSPATAKAAEALRNDAAARGFGLYAR
jgi:tetratricopeptide (TPR) repeat protein/tRNA A-37 threonylcarbamoyl transferase component Bud32